MPRHLTKRKLPGGVVAWKWQRAIHKPEEQAIFGKVVTRYLGIMSERKAEELRSKYDVEHDADVRLVRSLPKEERVRLVSVGGIESLQERARAAPSTSKALDAYGRLPLPDLLLPSTYPPDSRPGRATATLERRVALRNEIARRHSSLRTEIAVDKAIALKFAPTNEDSLDGLIVVWKKVNPHSNPRKYIASLKRLKTFVGGNIAWRSLTRPQCRGWRDELVKEYPPGSPSPTKHLDNIKGLFRAARIEGSVADDESPIKGIVVYGQTHNTEDDETGRPFAGPQIETILAKADEAACFDAYRTEVIWILKLMTWAGLRPNEAAQLRTSDVYVKDGTRIIHIRVTLPPDQQMQLKRGSLRKIPIHPAIADFFDYAKRARTDFIFHAFNFNKDNGRADWLMRRFGAFLRDDCKIRTPEGEKKLTLYSLRHSYHDAMDNCEPPIPDKMARVLAAHAKEDAHERYGKGAELSKLAKAAARINPLRLRTGASHEL